LKKANIALLDEDILHYKIA